MLKLVFSKPCSGYKLREISGSNIFSDHDEDGKSESGTDYGNFTNRTSVRIVQVSFSLFLKKNDKQCERAA